MKLDINRYVEERLEGWASWYIQYGDYNLGYPQKNYVWQMMKLGGFYIKPTVCPNLRCNKEAEEIESYVVELMRQKQILALVLREQYFGQGSVHCKAKRLKISYPFFRQHLDMAKQWMVGRLSEKFRRKFL